MKPETGPTAGVRCPHCNSDDTMVRDSRATTERRTRRRRLCQGCGQRFTTMGGLHLDDAQPLVSSYMETQVLNILARFSRRQARATLIMLRSMLPL